MKLQLWMASYRELGASERLGSSSAATAATQNCDDGQKLSPENITRPGSYFCRIALSRDRFGPK